MEGLSHHYYHGAYINKSTAEQIEMLVKKYSIGQLKYTIILSSAENANLRGMHLNAITTKAKAGSKLKEIIVPIIERTLLVEEVGSDKKR